MEVGKLTALLIRGGRVIDPANDVDDVLDVVVERGKIAGIGKDLGSEGAVLDAKGKIVAPGLIDMHVHLREPGREDEETIATGTRAALRGGFTTICAMPNTEPVADNASVIDLVEARATNYGLVNVLPIGAITKGQEGKEIVEMGELVAAGAVAFSDDGKSVGSAEVMRRALEYSKMFGAPIIAHCEDPSLSAGGAMHEGFASTCLGLRGMPSAAEEVMVARDVALAELTGAKLHIAHLSSAGSVEIVRRAKKRKLAVTCEVTPHHLVLTDEALATYDTNCKVNPPLRSADDRAALRKGLADGTIDAIATDHAPHAVHEKEIELIDASFGMIGLESAVPLLFTTLVVGEGFDAALVIAKLTSGPAVVLGIDAGTLSVGAVADITVIDPAASGTIETKRLESRSRNTPFGGWKVSGGVVDVIVGGKRLLREGEICQ